MKIFAVNSEYNGVTAGIKFDKGVAFCDDDNLVSWFINAGYRVEEDVKTEDVKTEDVKTEDVKKTKVAKK